MTVSEIFLYLLIAVVLLFYVRRMFLAMTIKTYTPGEIAGKMADKPAILLLDVRTKRERQSGNIKGSIHIPLHELGARSEELEKHKGKEIVCYCQTGSRSLSAAAKLRKRGYTVANLKGGIAEWNFQNLG